MATYDQLTEWAGLGHVTRASRDVVASWRIPDAMKAQLVEVGIPVTPRLIERVVTQSEADPGLLTSRGPLYRLTEQADPYEPAHLSSFGAEPGTGAVYFVKPDGGGHGSPTRVSTRGLMPFIATAAASLLQSFSASRTAPRSTSPTSRRNRLSPN